jgi:acyl-coenzyme A thioesterase PaaI-like protein
VLALFDAVAADGGPHRVCGTYHRRVSLATPCHLAVDRDEAATRLRLTDGATLLVDGAVGPIDESGDAVDAGGDQGPPPDREVAATPLPISKTCFACGVDNPLGLRARLQLDDRHVRGAWTPSPTLRTQGGMLATVAITTLLDEAAFWLGAAASGESGMTTTLRVDLYRAVPFGATVTVAGSRARVTALADDPRYWQTEVAAWDESGRPVARARIIFVAVRGAARKLVGGLLAMNEPQTLRRVFPAYVR